MTILQKARFERLKKQLLSVQKQLENASQKMIMSREDHDWLRDLITDCELLADKISEKC